MSRCKGATHCTDERNKTKLERQRTLGAKPWKPDWGYERGEVSSDFTEPPHLYSRLGAFDVSTRDK